MGKVAAVWKTDAACWVLILEYDGLYERVRTNHIGMAGVFV
jgi:hypothetical protein